MVDVREDWERAITAIPGSLHVPLAQLLEAGWAALPAQTATHLVLACKSGARSLRAASTLAQDPHGTPDGVRLWNLDGGTLGWFADLHGHAPAY